MLLAVPALIGVGIVEARRLTWPALAWLAGVVDSFSFLAFVLWLLVETVARVAAALFLSEKSAELGRGR